ncbi:MAG: hypothetical protein KDI39_09455 [Pseudomonadales bacterium]|nr:hypothetical protein [Pseudomonadales bacterium]
MANVCYVCDIDKGVEACIGCEKPVCKTHAGYMKNYLSIDGKKGRACNACIEEGIVTPDYGILSTQLIINDVVKRFENKMYPRMQGDIEKLTEKIKTESFAEAHVLVKELEQSVARTAENVTLQLEKTADKMVADNLAKVEQTLKELTKVLADAISSQRVEVSSDAEKIIKELSKTIQISLIYVAIIIVISVAGIKVVFG